MIALARLFLASVVLLAATRLWAQTPAIRWQRHSWTQEGIHAADLSPDGRWLALGFDNSFVRIVSSANPEEARLLIPPYSDGRTVGAVTGLAYSPTGDSLVTAEYGAGVFLWDLRADTIVRRIATMVPRNVPTTVAFDGRIVTVADGDVVERVSIDGGDSSRFAPGGAISPSGRFLLSMRKDSADRDVAVLVDLEQPESSRVLSQVTDFIDFVAFSEDEKVVAYAVLDFTGVGAHVLIYDIATGARLDSISDLGGAIGLSFTGDTLLARLQDRVVVRDRNRATVESIPLGHRGRYIEPSAFGLLPGGERIWIAEAHRAGAPYAVAIPSVAIIDLASGEVVAHVTGSLGARLARITPDGLEVVATDGANASRWTVDRGRLVGVPEYNLDQLCGLSIDGEYASMLRWHSESSTTQTLSYEGTRRTIPNSRIYGYVTGFRNGLAAPGGRFHLGDGREWNALWDVETQTSTRLPELEGAPAFSFDGSMLAASRRDGILVIYNTVTRDIMRRIPNVDPARRIVFSRDGGLIAAYRADGNVQIIDVDNGTAGRIVPTLDAGMSDHIFDHRGRFLLTASTDGSASVWDLHSDTRVERFDVGASVLSVDVSPDGRSIATVDVEGTLTVWDGPGLIAAITPTPHVRQASIVVKRIGASEMQAWLSAPSVENEMTLSVVDVLGRVLHAQSVRQLAQVPVVVDLPSFEPGWYLLVLARESEPIATRAIIVD